MIRACKLTWFDNWFAKQAEKRLKNTFATCHAHGIDAVRDLLTHHPVLFVANHTSWWDSLVVLVVCQRFLKIDGYALMDARNLAKLPFFVLAGAFGIDPSDPKDGAVGMRYTRSLLDRPQRAVWVFPQGEERPWESTGLQFQGGAAAMARLSKQARVVAVGMRYMFTSEEKPHLYVSFSNPLMGNPHLGTRAEEQALAVEDELKRIDGALAHQALWPTLWQSQPPKLSWPTRLLIAWARRRLTPKGPRR